MPKVTGPLFSVEADGTLAKALTYQNRPGGAAVYGYKKPKVPLTARQLWQRDLIKWCVYEWQTFSDAEKLVWEQKAQGQGQSGYSYFIHQRRGYLFDPDVALYLPLHDTRLGASQFLSMDSQGHLCTVTNASWTSYGRAFVGDGLISIPDAVSLSFGNGVTDLPFSVGGWVKMTDATNFGFIGKANDTSSPNIEWGFSLPSDDKLYFSCWDDSGASYISQNTGALTAYENQRIHLFATYSGSSTTAGILIYLNGVLQSMTASASGDYVAMHDTATPVRIGKVLTNRWAKGTIDDVLVCSGVKTALEIQNIYLATKSGH